MSETISKPGYVTSFLNMAHAEEFFAQRKGLAIESAPEQQKERERAASAAKIANVHMRQILNLNS